MNNKILKTMKKCLVILMAVIMAFGNAAEIFAESTPVYVSDIKIDDETTLTNAGYTVVPTDVNSKIGVGNLYLGYKITSNKSEAITDVKAMNMYGGFTKFSLEEAMTANASNIAKTANEIWTAITEFKNNLSGAGQYTPAKIAYDALNCLYVPETGETLGDYLISPSRTLSDITRVVLMSTTMVMSYIINILMFGLSDNMAESGKTTWLQRAVQSGAFSFEGMDEGQIEEFYKEYDSMYYQRAYNMLESLQLFGSLYKEALTVFPDGVVDEESYVAASEGAASGEIVESLDGGSDVDKTGDYIYAISAMNFLNSEDEYGYIYAYGSEEQSFGQYILNVAETALTNEQAACRMLYPLIVPINGQTALTQGQEIILGLSSFAMFVLITGNEDNAYVSLREAYEKSMADLLAANNGELISVWYGVNTEVYDNDGDIYMTSALSRQIASTGRYDAITKVTSEKEIKSTAIKNAMIIVGCVGIGVVGLGIIAGIVAVKFVGTTTAFGFTCCLNPGLLFACHVVGIAVVIIVVIIVIALIVMLVKYFKEKDKEEQVVSTFKWISVPKIIYDLGDSKDNSDAISYIGISAVGDGSGALAEPIDLNQGIADEVPWMCLYFTRDPRAGSPIMVSEGQHPFVVSESFAKPTGYSNVTFFEEKVAANITEGRLIGKTPYKYIFMQREDGGESEEVGGKYIADVILASEQSQDGALAAIRKKGYTPVQTNLTPNSGIYTYIGYSTTDNESDAVRDLRVAVGSGVDKGGGKITYGGSSYGLCGYAGNLMLFQTKMANAGTPILASGEYEVNGQSFSFSGFYVTNDKTAVPAGYEPIILFCGGSAFDFANCGNWETLKADEEEGYLIAGVGCEFLPFWQEHMYVYFNPVTKFTAENSEAYLGGLSFFSIPGGWTNSGTDQVRVYNRTISYYNIYTQSWVEPDTSYVAEMGWNILNKTNVGGYQHGTQTYLCYTETYNPYRAIYDIKYYAAADRNSQAVPYSIGYDSLGYAACDVFAQGGGNLTNVLRTMRITHSYRSNMFYEGGGQTDIQNAIDYFFAVNGVVPSANNGYWEVAEDGTLSPIRCVALYTTGKGNNSNSPLKVSDLVFTNSSTDYFDSTKYAPLRNFTDAYSKYSVNLGGDTVAGASDLYMFIKRADKNAKKPKYIASVTVGYTKTGATDGESPFDNTILSLIGNGTGQLYTYNLSGNAKDSAFYYYNLEVDDGSFMGIDLTKACTVQFKVFSSFYSKFAKVAYLWVTYTDDPKSALSDLFIYESSSATAPDRMDYYYSDTQKSPSSAYKCGKGWQVDGSDTYYYLYSINHNGHYITDIQCGSSVTYPGYWTTLTNDRQCSSLENLYIYTKHDMNEGAYISNIYIGRGTTRDEALRDLLNQGCQTNLNMDLNPNTPDCFEYMGFEYSSDYNDGYTGMLLLEAGQDDTITKIENGWDKYTFLTDNLNAAADDIIVRLYGSKSRSLAEINSGTGSSGRYVADITFANTNDKTLISLDEAGNEVNWNLVTDPDGNAQAICIGASYETSTVKTVYTVKDYELKHFLFFPYIKQTGSHDVVNYYTIKTDKGFLSNLYMYVHYSDNSFDPVSEPIVEEPIQEENLSGSVFGEYGSMIAVIAGIVIILAATFIVLQKRKKTEGNNEN